MVYHFRSFVFLFNIYNLLLYKMGLYQKITFYIFVFSGLLLFLWMYTYIWAIIWVSQVFYFYVLMPNVLLSPHSHCFLLMSVKQRKDIIWVYFYVLMIRLIIFFIVHFISWYIWSPKWNMFYETEFFCGNKKTFQWMNEEIYEHFCGFRFDWGLKVCWKNWNKWVYQCWIIILTKK